MHKVYFRWAHHWSRTVDQSAVSREMQMITFFSEISSFYFLYMNVAITSFLDIKYRMIFIAEKKIIAQKREFSKHS